MTSLAAHDIQQRIARRRRQHSRRGYLSRARRFLNGRAFFACSLVAILIWAAVR